jgi:hypothetical protein
MRVVSLTSLVVLATVSASLAAPYRIDPRHHQDGRPNAAAVIPPGWRLQPDEGRYVSPDGSSWFAPHASPVGSEPIAAHMDRIARQEGETVTYFRREADWIAVSGFKAGRIFYRKAVLACGGKVWHHIEFEYPAALKRRMDPFVNRASATARSWLGRISISRGYSFLTISGTGLGPKVFLANSGRPSQLEIGEIV